MELLIARGLELLVQGSPLFDALECTLRRGERIGLVGASGSGRSTLLELLAGERRPDAGSVARAPGVRLEWVGQRSSAPGISVAALVARAHHRLHDLEQALRAEERSMAAGVERLEIYGQLIEAFEASGGYGAESDARRALEAFGLPEANWDRRADSLSGGEFRRLQLALAMAAHPDVLLLDEPTNHLDLPMRRLLSERLARFSGGLLLASNDRALLDHVCSHIALLERGVLTRYRGDYSAFERQRNSARLRDVRRARERAKEEARIAETVTQLRRFGTASAQRRRKRFERQLEMLQDEDAAAAPGNTPTTALDRQSLPASGTLLAAQHLSKSFGDRTIIEDVSVTISAGDRIALIGGNGSGKSTLLALLAGELASDDPRARLRYGSGVRLAVADQQWRGVEASTTPFEALEKVAGSERARQMLAEIALPVERWQAPARELSGGELARVGLARIAASEANLLLLDEPANDLDLAGIDLLERDLLDGAATLLFTSHDQRLIERVATRLWSLVNGDLIEYRGGFPGYLADARRLESGLAETAAIDASDGSKDLGHVPVEVDALTVTDEIDESGNHLEDELAAIEHTLTDPLLLSHRVRGRLERRRREVIDALSELFDTRFPPPALRFAVREQGLEVRAEPKHPGRFASAGLELSTPPPLSLEVRVAGDVAHLRVQAPHDLCPLDWAVAAIATASARLCIYLLPIRTVQLQSDHDLSKTPFSAAGHGWWLLSRNALERHEGWCRAETE